MKKLNYLFLLSCFFFINSSRAQVELLFPRNNDELTDIAVSFRVKVSTDGPYELQVSKNQNFTAPVVKQARTVDDRYDDRNIVYFYSNYGTINPSKKFLLDPGTWYWRVTQDGGTTFSETRTLVVNDDKSPTPVQIDISPEKPFFHFRINSRTVYESSDPAALMKEMVPDHLKDYVVLDLGQSFFSNTQGVDLLEYSRFFDDLGYKFLFDSGGVGDLSPRGRSSLLSEIEMAFKELPNCVGAATSEAFYGYFFDEDKRSNIDGIIELCRKYGKVFSYGDMNWQAAKWPLFSYANYDSYLDKNYGDYLLPQNKTTDPWGAYTNVSSIQGMKLTGMIKNIGMWSDAWCWEKFGDVDDFELEEWMNGTHATGSGTKYHPYIQNMKQFIYGITYGSTVFTIEQSTQYDRFTGRPTDHYHRYLEPFINAVIDEKLIPSEQAINNNFKIIVDTGINTTDANSTPNITYMPGNIWGDVLRSTYGISDLAPYSDVVFTKQNYDIQQSAYLEMIPNTDRYPSGIPFLPKSSVSPPVINGTPLAVVKLEDLDTQAEADANLNIFYPESTNEAYAQIIDNSIFVFNTLENHDIKQSYTLNINHAGIESLSGNIDLMSYVIGKLKPDDGGSIFFQVNGYVPNPSLREGEYSLPAYPSILTFKCTAQPNIKIEELGAIKNYNWNDATNELSIEIDHTIAGAVNFTLQQDPVTETISIDDVPDLITTSSNLDFKIGYNLRETRDIVVSVLDPNDVIMASTTKTIIKGVNNDVFTLNFNPIPASGTGYSVVAQIRPVGGDETQIIVEKKTPFEFLTEATCPNTDVYNECFENGIGLWFGGSGTAIREVQRNEVYQGNYALMVKGEGASAATISNLNPNNNYQIKAFAKNLGTGNINFGLKDHGGPEQSTSVTNTTFEEKTLSFTTGANNTSVRVYYYSPNSDAEGYLDNISLIDLGCAGANCNDTDLDGVLNADDDCPNTPAGAAVDSNGCEVFSVVADNFLIKTTGETCSSKNNGSVLITVQNSNNASYTAILSGNGVDVTKNFTAQTIFEDLGAGEYTLQITVAEDPDFNGEFTITVGEPEALGVTSKVNNNSKTVSLNFNGGQQYNISVNNRLFRTKASNITLPLEDGLNYVVVKSDKDCQGIYSQQFVIGSELKLFPNPATQELNILLPMSNSKIEAINIIDLVGKNKQLYPYVANGEYSLKVDISNLKKGFYFANIVTNKNSYTLKFIKK
ncbi:T9SS type A sorting domain-containing protein [Flavivirga rizhaonensis]|uniref:T9SS type A sorting domain-containing protein n=1 Tax=Flavivirga rizhaonensis TaxID=2559571 RepID=A0A4S1DT68_9FLAO|nr:T9SS type A sorting domain-containing protein [Flavivirga rizhaonensis]TGV00973.1 T9SS type A sorting domain-containing protein [Flavivirga rizhaonensis]